MPIFAYFVAVGAVLIALIFVTNATLEKGGPAIVTTQRVGLPESQLPNPTQILTSTPAPAPDMTSPLVLVAAPKVQPEVQAVVPAARAARAEAPPQHKPVTGPRDFGLAGM
ncbi:MAG: hypothetical protein WB037_10485 [Pseudolabrys sp.]|jgi:hypothetical protein